MTKTQDLATLQKTGQAQQVSDKTTRTKLQMLRICVAAYQPLAHQSFRPLLNIDDMSMGELASMAVARTPVEPLAKHLSALGYGAVPTCGDVMKAGLLTKQDMHDVYCWCMSMTDSITGGQITRRFEMKVDRHSED